MSQMSPGNSQNSTGDPTNDFLADVGVSTLLGYMLLNSVSLKSLSDLEEAMDLKSDEIRDAISKIRAFGFAVEFEGQTGLVEWNEPFNESNSKKISADELSKIRNKLHKSVSNLRARSSKDEILDFLSSPIDFPTRRGSGS